jgi:hypothetical protein
MARNINPGQITDSADPSGVPLGTPTNPLRVDPTGTTVQPVSGSFSLGAGSAVQILDSGGVNKLSVNASGQIPISALPTGANTIGKIDILGNAGATLDSTVGTGTAPTNMLVVGEQYNVANPEPTNGQTMALQADQAGNLLNFPSAQFEPGASWSSATAINTLQYQTGTTAPGQLNGATAVLIQLDQTTTITGGAVTFQGTYDNINWVTIPGFQVLSPTTNLPLQQPYTFVASTNQPFLILTQGYVAVRLNLTTVITGTGTVTPFWSTLPSDARTIATGILTNGSAGLGGNNIGVLPALANAAAPLYNEGAQNLLSTLLNGFLRVAIGSFAGLSLDGPIAAGAAPTRGLATISQYSTTAPAPTNAQVMAVQSDSSGSIFVKPIRRSETVVKATTITNSTTATTVVTAQAAGIFADVSSLVITVTPAATTALVFTATLSDGTNSYIYDMDTGTVASSVGFPINIIFNPPLIATTAATAWTITLSVNTVTVHITTVAVLQKAS